MLESSPFITPYRLLLKQCALKGSSKNTRLRQPLIEIQLGGCIIIEFLIYWIWEICMATCHSQHPFIDNLLIIKTIL